MKIKDMKLERSGDRMSLTGNALDNLRRPAKIAINIQRGDSVEVSPQNVILAGDVSDVMGTLGAFADIAWRNGWRPGGLAATMVKTVENFVPLKPE